MTTFVLVHGAWCGSWLWNRVRRHLQGTGHEAFTPTLTGLAELYGEYVSTREGVPLDAWRGFIDVLAADARAAQAGLRLVMAQPNISSQLIDNLNASIHVRALLTDIFLIDEALK